MLVQRLQRWTSIDATLGRCILFAGQCRMSLARLSTVIHLNELKFVPVQKAPLPPSRAACRLAQRLLMVAPAALTLERHWADVGKWIRIHPEAGVFLGKMVVGGVDCEREWWPAKQGGSIYTATGVTPTGRALVAPSGVWGRLSAR